MVLDVDINDESARRVDKFLVTNKYKELAENAMSFNRKLNEERKMRIPYVDGQVRIHFVLLSTQPMDQLVRKMIDSDRLPTLVLLIIALDFPV